MSTHQDINAFRAQRIANTHDPLALMANTQTPFHPDQSSLITYIQHPQPNNNFVPQPSFNTNYLNGNVETSPAEGNGNGINDGSAEVHLSKNCYDNDIFNMFTQEEQYTELLEPIHEPHQVPQNDSNVIFKVFSVGQGGGIVEQHPANVEETYEIFPIVKQVDAREQNFEIQFLKEAAKFVRDFKSLAKEADESIAKQKALELEIERLLREVIERLQAQLGDLKGKSKDTSSVSDTLNPLPQKLENENVSEKKDTTHGTSVNTKFAKQSILGKPPSPSRPKLYAVTPLPKSTVLPKVGKTHALSKPVTTILVPTPTELKVVKNDNVISVGIFRINPFKASRVDNFVPNKHVKASIRTKPITVSQPHVITKNDENSKTNGFSPKDVKSATRTRRPQPRNNTKSDKVPFKSKSSCLSNNLEKIEENHKNLQSSSNKKHVICM
uniref:Reverse transcriptase domain-containing protein n=1 Tax=Tanacetum cinerariifolium TaxID=118510 RepID=A0A6L2JK19_TANCI|nr:hypothetical protein [Tanacetum cinerariifolium]